jgi:hypothetical protein
VHRRAPLEPRGCRPGGRSHSRRQAPAADAESAAAAATGGSSGRCGPTASAQAVAEPHHGDARRTATPTRLPDPLAARCLRRADGGRRRASDGTAPEVERLPVRGSGGAEGDRWIRSWRSPSSSFIVCLIFCDGRAVAGVVSVDRPEVTMLRVPRSRQVTRDTVGAALEDGRRQ